MSHGRSRSLSLIHHQQNPLETWPWLDNAMVVEQLNFDGPETIPAHTRSLSNPTISSSTSDLSDFQFSSSRGSDIRPLDDFRSLTVTPPLKPSLTVTLPPPAPGNWSVVETAPNFSMDHSEDAPRIISRDCLYSIPLRYSQSWPSHPLHHPALADDHLAPCHAGGRRSAINLNVEISHLSFNQVYPMEGSTNPFELTRPFNPIAPSSFRHQNATDVHDEHSAPFGLCRTYSSPLSEPGFNPTDPLYPPYCTPYGQFGVNSTPNSAVATPAATPSSASSFTSKFFHSHESRLAAPSTPLTPEDGLSETESSLHNMRRDLSLPQGVNTPLNHLDGRPDYLLNIGLAGVPSSLFDDPTLDAGDSIGSTSNVTVLESAFKPYNQLLILPTSPRMLKDDIIRACKCPKGPTKRPLRHWDICPSNPKQRKILCDYCGTYQPARSDNLKRHQRSCGANGLVRIDSATFCQ